MRAALRRRWWTAVLSAALALGCALAVAEEYLGREQFLALAFPQAEPVMQMVWLTAAMKQDAERALGAAPAALRVRYWAAGDRRAWILDEIGKEQPITIGVVVERGRIERVSILAFRESRGWEIRHGFFTDQYRAIALDARGALSREVDGITGATLSVRAVNRAARLALWLDAQAEAALAAR